MDDLKIVPSTRRSWMVDTYRGKSLYPTVKNQLLVSGESCVHHSLCTSIEARSRLVWVDQGIYETLKVCMACPRDLVSRYGEPTKACRLIGKIIGQAGGVMVASNQKQHGKPFRLTGCATYYPAAGGMQEAITHLYASGPILGSFYPTDLYQPSTGRLFNGEGERIQSWSKKRKMYVDVSHCVCIVGTVFVMHNNEQKLAFEFLECDNPAINTINGDGVCYMLADVIVKLDVPMV